MSKKAVDFPKYLLVSLILLVVIIVIMWPLFNKTKDVAESEAHKAQCSESVRVNSAAHIKGISINFLKTQINCPTVYKTLEGDSTTLKSEIANQMADTWSVYGMGKLDLFDGTDTYCAIYSVLDFKDKKQKITDFGDFLKTNYVPGKKETYISFLSQFSSLESADLTQDMLKNSQIQASIDASKSYAVIFFYSKNDEMIKHITAAASTTPGKIAMSSTAMAVFGVATVVVGIFTGGVGGVVMGIVGTSLAAGGSSIAYASAPAALLASENTNKWLAFTVLKEYNAEELNKLNCTTLPVYQGNRPKGST